MNPRVRILGIFSIAVISVLMALTWGVSSSDFWGRYAARAEPQGPAAPIPSIAASDDRNPIFPTAQLSARAGQGEPLAGLYFLPQDGNYNTTVLVLHNTRPVGQSVQIDAYAADGRLNFSTTIQLAPGEVKRVISDRLADEAPASWRSSVVIDFSELTLWAVARLPEGVRLDGYITWQEENLFNPDRARSEVPLRFSRLEFTTYLPGVVR